VEIKSVSNISLALIRKKANCYFNHIDINIPFPYIGVGKKIHLAGKIAPKNSG
jgi:hypothetical protein